MKKFQAHSGFAHMALIVILVVAAGIGSIAYVVYSRQTSQSADQVSSQVKPSTENVPTAPEIKDAADLDKTQQTLDQIDPTTDSQSDLNAIDSQIKDF